VYGKPCLTTGTERYNSPSTRVKQEPSTRESKTEAVSPRKHTALASVSSERTADHIGKSALRTPKSSQCTEASGLREIEQSLGGGPFPLQRSFHTELESVPEVERWRNVADILVELKAQLDDLKESIEEDAFSDDPDTEDDDDMEESDDEHLCSEPEQPELSDEKSGTATTKHSLKRRL